MALTVGDVLDRVSKKLLDDGEGRWDHDELRDDLNAGAMAVANHKPDATATSVMHTLDDTTSRQTIPADGIIPLNVVRNGESGDQTGRAVTLIDAEDLTAMDPAWHVATGDDVEHWVYDKRDTKAFYVYPRATGAVQLVYSAQPTRVTADSEDLPLPDTYESVLYHFVLAHAYAKNTKRGDTGKFDRNIAIFERLLGVKTQGQGAYAPMPTERTESQTGAV
ncbi:phage adaptor protein [Algiphilus aromaticivorans]|uniref:phage adaptor protein n=1 Tax=Algiphilus aromaticivorans TaxID=382454 RepID=UPI000693880C|nr:DUF6682 family protein [Algiphilus aromaticivorans]